MAKQSNGNNDNNPNDNNNDNNNDNDVDNDVDNESKKNKNLIQLDMNETVAQGAYANLALSNVNQEEFVLDFIFLQPNINKGQVRSRIIMTPKNIKRLVKMLDNQLNDYEKNIGSVDDTPELPQINLSFN